MIFLILRSFLLFRMKKVYYLIRTKVRLLDSYICCTRFQLSLHISTYSSCNNSFLVLRKQYTGLGKSQSVYLNFRVSIQKLWTSKLGHSDCCPTLYYFVENTRKTKTEKNVTAKWTFHQQRESKMFSYC